MSWLPSAADGLFAGILSAGTGTASMLWARREARPQRRSAWEKQAKELRDELRRANAERIDYLEGQVASRDVDIAHRDAEISRLNRLLNQQRRGGADDRA